MAKNTWSVKDVVKLGIQIGAMVVALSISFVRLESKLDIVDVKLENVTEQVKKIDGVVDQITSDLTSRVIILETKYAKQ